MTQSIRNHTDDFTLDAFDTTFETSDATAQQLPPQPRFHLTSYIIGLLTALVLVGGMNLLLRGSEPAPIALHPPPTAAPTATSLPTATPAPMVVFVSGAVREPGLYALAPEARVGDALAAAGGMTLLANPSLVNQAERLWDGAQVHVPAAQPAPGPAVEPGSESADVPTQAIAIAEPPVGLSGSTTAPTGRSNLGSGNTSGLVNLNLASPTDLETLPGIGPSKAAAIVANRPYNTIDELERVPGIGAKTIEQLRTLVTVE